MTSHENCAHKNSKAGRAACRRAGGVFFFHAKLRDQIQREATAICENCFWTAVESATENLAEAGEIVTTDDVAGIIVQAKIYLAARGYMFDAGGISACSEHAHHCN